MPHRPASCIPEPTTGSLSLKFHSFRSTNWRWLPSSWWIVCIKSLEFITPPSKYYCIAFNPKDAPATEGVFPVGNISMRIGFEFRSPSIAVALPSPGWSSSSRHGSRPKIDFIRDSRAVRAPITRFSSKNIRNNSHFQSSTELEMRFLEHTLD